MRLVDFSGWSPSQVEKISRTVPEYVTVQPRASVLLLVDFSGASFDEEAMRTMKESAVFDKPFIKRTAWTGADKFLGLFRESLKNFYHREFPTFQNRQQALAWLVKE